MDLEPPLGGVARTCEDPTFGAGQLGPLLSPSVVGGEPQWIFGIWDLGPGQYLVYCPAKGYLQNKLTESAIIATVVLGGTRCKVFNLGIAFRLSSAQLRQNIILLESSHCPAGRRYRFIDYKLTLELQDDESILPLRKSTTTTAI